MTTQTPSGNVLATQMCLYCSEVLPKGRSRTYCSDNCRVNAWKRRNKAAVSQAEIPKSPSTKATTIYECPQCDKRYLGDQYCYECGSFCTKVGSGGLCPHCDEPVAFIDLIETSNL